MAWRPAVFWCVLCALCVLHVRVSAAVRNERAPGLATQMTGTNNTDLHSRDICGDNIVAFGETCDDGNTAAGDGCSQLCALESGYMCYSSLRSSDATAVGTLVKWDLSTDSGTHSNVLRVLAAPERCTGGNICQYQHKWQPEIWAAVYGNSTSNAGLPPAGYYCSRFCQETFTPPPGYEFDRSCQPTPVNECIRGLTTCDSNAYCLEPPDGIGYACRCDPDFSYQDCRARGVTEAELS